MARELWRTVEKNLAEFGAEIFSRASPRKNSELATAAVAKSRPVPDSENLNAGIAPERPCWPGLQTIP
jgi:hypothetical protein